MSLRFFCLSAVVSIALVGCSDDEETATPSTTDTGVTTDTGSPTDSGSPADTSGPGDTGNMPDTPDDAPVGPTCAAYCDTVIEACTSAKNIQYATASGPTMLAAKARCMLMCNDMTLGTAGAASGDTVACRLTHANLAKTEGPDVHCPHAGAFGGGVCGANRCDTFCALAVKRCGTKAPFADEAACKTACAAMTFNPAATGGELDQTKGTLNCVQYHLQAAYESEAATNTHCPHLTVTAAGMPCTP